MKFIAIEIDPDSEMLFTPIGAYDNRTDATNAAKEFVKRYSGSRTGIYRYEHGYSSKSQVLVSPEYYPPEAPAQELPPDADPGPAQNWTEDVENAALAKDERAG